MTTFFSVLFLILMIGSTTQAMESLEIPTISSHARTKKFVSNTLFRGYYFARYRFNDTKNEFEINIETDRRLSRGSLIYSRKCNQDGPICEISRITITQDCENILPILLEFLSTQLACIKCVIHVDPEHDALVKACIKAGFTMPDENTLVYSPRHSSL